MLLHSRGYIPERLSAIPSVVSSRKSRAVSGSEVVIYALWAVTLRTPVGPCIFFLLIRKLGISLQSKAMKGYLDRCNVCGIRCYMNTKDYFLSLSL